MGDHGISILLVEDDDVDAEAIQRAFAEHRITNPVIRARDGTEASRVFWQHRQRWPFIVLLDLNLPRVDGIQLLSQLREQAFGDPAVLVLTTSNAECDKQAARQHDISGYFVKSQLRDDFLPLIECLRATLRALAVSKRTQEPSSEAGP